MNMIDGLLLLVDINEGPMPQTRYILDKALSKGLCPLLIFNKLDRIFDPVRIDDSLMEINLSPGMLSIEIFVARFACLLLRGYFRFACNVNTE